MPKVAFTAPHAEAAQAGMSVLEAGGNAVDAMIAAAAMVAVHYPHMNSLGGDGFWLIQRKGQPPVAIDACGGAAEAATLDAYRAQGSTIPERGPLSALTMAGTVAGWQSAREYMFSTERLAKTGASLLPLNELFAPAVTAAQQGIEVTQSLLAAMTLCDEAFGGGSHCFQPFRDIYGTTLPKVGDTLSNLKLAELLNALSDQGLDSFYRGDIAETLATELSEAGSPLSLSDFHTFYARRCEPLSVSISNGRLYNLGAPTQGIASLIILALYDRLRDESRFSNADFVHRIVEATKQAFIVRDRFVVDPDYLHDDWSTLLDEAAIERYLSNIDLHTAQPWPHCAEKGDTVWMGAVDRFGTAVSFIQSIYWEFGSGVVLPSYGLLWNNRGVSFSLDPKDANVLAPGKKPRHTLNPALAELDSGERIVYGTMGGEGQPQTQAALFARYVYQGLSLNEAINLPRWLLGRTWGEQSSNLKIEATLFDEVAPELQKRGHDVARVDDYVEFMGHAGAISIDDSGALDAATDRRSDGAALMNELKE